ncbi:hypothetical protein V8F20_012054 [Naviculisporaceae sp. PSN 640]
MSRLTYAAIVLSALGGSFTLPSAAGSNIIPDLGFWDVNITIARGAQGHEAQFTWAIYSGNPTKTIYDEWFFNPQGENITSVRNTRDFTITVGGDCGNGMGVVLKQRVVIGNKQYWIVGKATPNFRVISANGRGGTASFRANATLDPGICN